MHDPDHWRDERGARQEYEAEAGEGLATLGGRLVDFRLSILHDLLAHGEEFLEPFFGRGRNMGRVG